MDIGNATLAVLPASTGTLTTDRLLLPGGATADVFVDDDGDTLVQVGADAVTPSQLVAGVLRSPDLAVEGPVVELAVVADRGHERLVLSRDRRAVFVHARHVADAAGPAVAVVRADPDLDQHGVPRADVHGRVAALLARVLVAPASVTCVHVRPGGDARDGGRRLLELQDADLVIPAWGALDGPPGPAAEAVDEVVAELREARDGGTRVLVRTVDGVPATQGRPAGPASSLEHGAAVRLVDAPADWLWGAPLA